MLCRKCWMEEASVHFRCFSRGRVHEIAYCLACAQHEPLSWLLAWGHGREPAPSRPLSVPTIVRAGAGWWGIRGAAATLVATGVARCPCGCRIVVGAEMACEHGAYLLGGEETVVEHACHCGRDHAIWVPGVVCLECGGEPLVSIVATARTCLWQEQRRRLITVDGELRHGEATWGTFSLHN